MIVDTPAFDVTQYAAQYEQLRAQVVGARPDLTRASAALPRGIGLALLLREGMPGWLKAVETVLRASSAARSTDGASPPESPLVRAVTALPLSSSLSD